MRLLKREGAGNKVPAITERRQNSKRAARRAASEPHCFQVSFEPIQLIQQRAADRNAVRRKSITHRLARRYPPRKENIYVSLSAGLRRGGGGWVREGRLRFQIDRIESIDVQWRILENDSGLHFNRVAKKSKKVTVLLCQLL